MFGFAHNLFLKTKKPHDLLHTYRKNIQWKLTLLLLFNTCPKE